MNIQLRKLHLLIQHFMISQLRHTTFITQSLKEIHSGRETGLIDTGPFILLTCKGDSHHSELVSYQNRLDCRFAFGMSINVQECRLSQGQFFSRAAFCASLLARCTAKLRYMLCDWLNIPFKNVQLPILNTND